MKIINSERKPDTPYIVASGKNPELADKLQSALVEETGNEPELRFNVGCIISINTGPDFVGIVYQR